MSLQTPKVKIRIKKPTHERRPSHDSGKRRRLASGDAEFVPSPVTPFTFAADSPVVNTHPPGSVSSAVTSFNYSANALDADANNAYQNIITHEQDDKETKRAYARHLTAYQTWWEQYQAHVLATDPDRTYIPAFPVTVSKAVMFLDYESKRPKKVFYFVFPIIHSG
jgi:hypothetical protein